jgi:hypothetical protein
MRKKGRHHMATLEERVQALEQEHAELKKAIELQTVAIGALVSKTTLEKLIEQDDKLFDTLIAHDRLTNERLGDLQTQVIELDGKITGLQVETRQGFTRADQRMMELDGKVTGLQVETRQGFTRVDQRMDGVDQRLRGIEQSLQQLTAFITKPEQGEA